MDANIFSSHTRICHQNGVQALVWSYWYLWQLRSPTPAHPETRQVLTWPLLSYAVGMTAQLPGVGSQSHDAHKTDRIGLQGALAVKQIRPLSIRLLLGCSDAKLKLS